MIEVEVKGYADKEGLKKLREVCELIEEKRQVDLYFNHPSRDFRETDEALRIRIDEFKGIKKYFLTYKGPKLDEKSKTREEVEVEVEDAQKMAKLLDKLGFRKTLEIVKRRWVFKHGEYMLFFDEVEGLGTFIEVETTVENLNEFPLKRDEMIDFLKEIGVNKLERRSYLELALEKLKL